MKREAINSDLTSLLDELFNIREFNKFYLIGGTNLALKYNHRISTDLDLFADYDENVNLEKYSSILEQNFKFDLKLNSISNQTLRTSIRGIKVDLMHWSWVKNRIAPIENFKNTQWKMASDLDIGALKLQAIINRGTKKDFIDIALLFQKFDLKTLIEAYKNKYDVNNDVEILKYLVDFFQADLESNANIQLIDFNLKNWEAVKEYIISKVKEYIH